ncbi:MAG: beta-eliminating lyase-related protein, partial [Planctomycetota bacterium]
VGLEEVLSDDYLHYRVRSVEYLGEKLLAGGVQIVRPPGGHAVYIDAEAFCPHIPRSQFPGQAVACALYEHGGIRSCEIGSIMLGDQATTELVRLAVPRRTYTQSHIDYVVQATTELVRLAVPRRTYTQSHIDYVVEVVLEVKQKAGELSGFRITEQAGALRHFTARFERCDDPVTSEPSADHGSSGS